MKVYTNLTSPSTDLNTRSNCVSATKSCMEDRSLASGQVLDRDMNIEYVQDAEDRLLSISTDRQLHITSARSYSERVQVQYHRHRQRSYRSLHQDLGVYSAHLSS